MPPPDATLVRQEVAFPCNVHLLRRKDDSLLMIFLKGLLSACKVTLFLPFLQVSCTDKTNGLTVLAFPAVYVWKPPESFMGGLRNSSTGFSPFDSRQQIIHKGNIILLYNLLISLKFHTFMPSKQNF